MVTLSQHFAHVGFGSLVGTGTPAGHLRYSCADSLTVFRPATKTGTPITFLCGNTTRSTQADWAHLSSDILSGIVLKNSLDSHKQMHLVCRQWNTSVRCNMHTMHPKILSTEQLKLYFPALRNLHLTKVAFKQNSTLCLATLDRLHTLRLQSCAFDKCESVAELRMLTGT